MAEEFTTARTVELMKMQSVLAESVNSYRAEIEVLQKEKDKLDGLVISAKEAEEKATLSASNEQALLDDLRNKTELSTNALNDVEVLLSTKREELARLDHEMIATLTAVERAKEAFAKHESDVKRAMDEAKAGCDAVIAERNAMLATVDKSIAERQMELETLSQKLTARQSDITLTEELLADAQKSLEERKEALRLLSIEESQFAQRLAEMMASEPALSASVTELQSRVDGLASQLRDFEVAKAGVADLARALAGKEELLRSLYGDMGLKW